MEPNDLPELNKMLEELCTIYNRPFTEALTAGYYRYLKNFSFPAVRQSMLRLMGESQRKQVMPLPAEIKALAPQFERQRQGASLDDERWRRRYDVWQTGRFSNEALDVAFQLTDAELGLDTVGDDEGYLRCQQPGCRGLVPWPSHQTGPGRMFCPQHQPDPHADPITTAEKQAILAQATPQAKAFLRSIPEIARLMPDIPITAAEQAAADADEVPLRAKAFEQTAEGPGVNPGVFLNYEHIIGNGAGKPAWTREETDSSDHA